MTAATQTSNFLAVRGSILHFLDDPEHSRDEDAFEFYDDGLLVAEGGYITKAGNANELISELPKDLQITNCTGSLIMPGFVDAHTHFVQSDIVGSYGRRLIDWLDEYAFPAERAFADPAHAGKVAELFLRELLGNGTTTALILGSVHSGSVDAIFEETRSRGMRVIAGKVMMDRNCPEDLRDTAATGYEESQALIERWHNRDRLQYASTPRFAPTSTDEQLAAAGRLAGEHADVYVQTHLAENEEEVAWVAELFPDSRSYLDVYDRHGLLRKRSMLAHGIWLDDEDLQRLAQTGAAIAHCPSCNLFMGSGLFDLDKTTAAGVRVSMGTDIGGGTTFSMLRVMHEAYKVSQILGKKLSPLRAFYLATLAGAQSLDLNDHIGNFLPGKEADFVVLDPQATPLLARRWSQSQTLAEKLFVMMMLGDDRAVVSTYVMGERLHDQQTE